MQFHRVIFSSAVVFALLSGCGANGSLFDNGSGIIDPQGQLTRDDYRKTMTPASVAAAEAGTAPLELDDVPPIPDETSILVAPRPPKLAEEKTVSISVTEDIPLKDVFIELARLADVDLELDPNITGGIIFRAKERPFSKVVERICDMAKLHCTLENQVLKAMVDAPYMVNYPIDFLNLVRSSDGSVNVSTNVLSASESSAESLNTGSSSTITTVAENDFWESFNMGIASILQLEGSGGEVKSSATASKADTTSANQSSGEQGHAGVQSDTAHFTINKQAGVLSVSASHVQHKKLRDYLAQIKKSVSAQVLIEAKIVEVTLDEGFESGIDWGSIAFDGNIDFDFTLSSNVSDPVGLLTLRNGKKGDALESAVSLTETFGVTRTLSSPRLHAMNNQQAVLTFAENRVYFDINVERETDTSSSTTQELFTVDSEVKTVPIGIIVVLQPSIDTETDEITLNIRPTVSRFLREVSDPAVSFLVSQSAGLDIENLIPVVEVRELDSVMKMKSGDIMVVGGLMEQRQKSNDRGFPGMSRIPYLGSAFKKTEKSTETVEMVIFIKATVVKGNSYDNQDVDVYHKFTNDPRPLAF